MRHLDKDIKKRSKGFRRIFRFRFLKRFFKLVIVLIILGIICALVGVFIFNRNCSNTQAEFRPLNDPYIDTEITDIAHKNAGYLRAEEGTYLTFPEWYLVFNPQEYAEYLKANRPSAFPYFASIKQFWHGYCEVYGLTKTDYPFNGGKHLMVSVIGISFTVEYLVKGAYENTIGLFSEGISIGAMTEEDIFAAKVAYDYGAFIPDLPWYEFPFAQKLSGLWTETSLFGPHILRKWERKFFLSIEYGVKAVYAKLITLGTHTVYEPAATDVQMIVTNISPSAKVFENPRVRELKKVGEKYMIAVPHYQGFTDTVPVLASKGVEFLDIAGNDEILLSAIAPSGFEYDLPTGKVLFSMKMMTSDKVRILVQVPIKNMTTILNTLKEQGVAIEHLYDY